MNRLKYPVPERKKGSTLKIVAIIFAVLVLISLVSALARKGQEQAARNKIIQANKEFETKVKSNLSDNTGLPKGFTFKSSEFKSPKLTLTYNVDINKVEDKNFVNDLIATTSLMLFNSIKEIEVYSSYTEYEIKYSNLATATAHSYDFVNDEIALTTVQANIKTKDGNYEKEIKNSNNKRLQIEKTRYDTYVNSMNIYIQKIADAALQDDYTTLNNVFINARNYRDKVAMGLNTARENKNPNTINKVNAAYDVLTQYTGLLDKIEKTITTGKDGIISQEAKTKYFYKTIEKYNNTK